MNIIEDKALMERVGDNELYREPMGVEIRWVVVFEVRFGAAGVKFSSSCRCSPLSRKLSGLLANEDGTAEFILSFLLWNGSFLFFKQREEETC